VGIDEVAERVVDLPEADEQAQSSNEPETKTKVGVPLRQFVSESVRKAFDFGL